MWLWLSRNSRHLVHCVKGWWSSNMEIIRKAISCGWSGRPFPGDDQEDHFLWVMGKAISWGWLGRPFPGRMEAGVTIKGFLLMTGASLRDSISHSFHSTTNLVADCSKLTSCEGISHSNHNNKQLFWNPLEHFFFMFLKNMWDLKW